MTVNFKQFYSERQAQSQHISGKVLKHPLSCELLEKIINLQLRALFSIFKSENKQIPTFNGCCEGSVTNYTLRE